MSQIHEARRFPPLSSSTHRLLSDRSGASAVVVGLILTAVVGLAGLGTEGSLWYVTKRQMQGAADAGAFSAALAGTSYINQAKAITASNGYAAGTGGVTVTVNSPPLSGNYTTVSNAVEVIIAQPQSRLMSGLFLGVDPTISARAVAVPGSGDDCVLALDKTASGAISNNGTTNVNLVKCGLADDSRSGSAMSVTGGASITADSVSIVGGLSTSNGGTVSTVSTPGPITGAAPVEDPYANVLVPPLSGCNYNNLPPIHGTVSFDAGGGTVVFCNGVTVNGGGTLNLSNGIFVIDRGSLSIAGGATLNLTNATIVLTSSSGSNWGTVTINGGATVNATAPTTGPTAGLAFFQDRNAPSGTNNFNGGSAQNITGAIYFPSQTIVYSGGATTGSGCTQIIGDQVVFTGNSAVESNCTGKGTRTIASRTKLVE